MMNCNIRRMTNLAVAGFCLLALPVGDAHAQGVVRAWGMGRTGVAASRGLEAVAYNPANLAFSRGTTVGLAAVAADVHNNALSLDRYNEITGSYLDSADKAQLLSDIPASGFKLDADVRASAFGFQSGGLALSFTGLGSGQGNLDKDYFDLVLNGNQLGETIDFSNTWGAGSAYGAATLSYGLTVLDVGLGKLAVGASARFLQGFYEMHVAEAYGRLSTSLTAIDGEAYVATESARGGQGYGLDVGLALETAGGWQVGLALENAMGFIDWNRDVERQEMRVTAADINLLSGDLNAAVSDADTTYAGTGYRTTLPRRARLGAARQFGALVLAADYVQGFSDQGVTSKKPLLNTGLEWRVLSFLHPRLGLSSGGERGNSATAGVGLKVGPWRVDVAAMARGGMSAGQSKGVGVAVGSLLQF